MLEMGILAGTMMLYKCYVVCQQFNTMLHSLDHLSVITSHNEYLIQNKSDGCQVNW